MNLFITGSKGFIGSRFVEHISKYEKHNIKHTDSYLFKKSIVNKDNYKKKSNFLQKDLRDLNEKDISNYDVFVHFAALSNDPLGKFKASLTNEINFKQTLRLAKLAKKLGYKKFIYSSSCIMYGESGDSIYVTEKSDRKPVTAYAKSKVKSEDEIIKLSDKNFKVICIRNGTIYGFSNYLRIDTVLNNFIFNALKYKKITIEGDGLPWRPVTHIDDVCRYFEHFIDVKSEKIKFNEYNLGTNHSNIQIIKLAELVKNHLKNIEIAVNNSNYSDRRSYKVKFNRFKNNFPEFKFKLNFEKGINKTIADFRKFKIINASKTKSFVRLEDLNYLTSNKLIDDNLKLIN